MKNEKIKSAFKKQFLSYITSITYLGVAYPGEATTEIR